METPITPREQYRKLTERLLENEEWGTLSEAEEDALRDRMDSLWWAMSEGERQEADRWLAARRTRAPEDLGLKEV